MTFLLACVADVSVVLALALSAAALLRRRSAALRHAILAIAIVLACLMPALKLALPEIPLVRLPGGARIVSSGLTWVSDANQVTSTAGSGVARAADGLHWPIGLLVLWALGAAALTAAFVVGLVRLSRLRARCTQPPERWREWLDSLRRETGFRRHVVLLQSAEPSLMVACGIVTPRIILPSGAPAWTEERARVVLRHELAHIRRHDAVVQIAGEVLRIVHWFNPLVWAACRRLRQESEYASDDAVLAAHVEAADYATHLLGVARELSVPRAISASALAIAHPSTLERRIAAMLLRQRNRAPMTRLGWFAAAFVALGVTVPIAGAGVAQTDAAAAAPFARDVALAAPAPAPAMAATSPPARASRPSRPAPVARQTGSIGGTLRDQLGGTIPGARVTLTNLDTGAEASTETDAIGNFVFGNLQPGRYEAVATVPGFKAASLRVTLTDGASVHPVFTLALGTVQETITVVCGGTSAAARLGGFAGRVSEALFPTLYAREVQPVRVGGSVRMPTKIKDVRPVCPATVPAVDTTVQLSGVVGTDGLVTDLAPVASEPADAPPPSELIDSAATAIRQWRFTPTLLDGQPMEVGISIRVTFRKP